jgi:predicted DNA-binding transcriptional regulator AlpA
MVPSTKLITIREAANRLGLKESTIRKYILKTADRLCEAVGARCADSY